MYAPDVADCIYALGCLNLALRPTLPWLNLGCFFSAALKNLRFAVPKDRRISGESKGTPVPPRILAEFTFGDVGIGIPFYLIRLNII